MIRFYDSFANPEYLSLVLSAISPLLETVFPNKNAEELTCIPYCATPQQTTTTECGAFIFYYLMDFLFYQRHLLNH